MNFLILISVFILSLFIPLQDDKDEYLIWSSNTHLNWSYFKGKPILNSEHSAVTWTLIKRETKSISDNEWILSISTLFIVNESWVKSNKIDSNLLSHEQLHWDIAELFARKLRKKISNHKSQNIDSTTFFINKEYDKMLIEKRSFQDKYDYETNFSINHSKQKVWNNLIHKKLKEYESYSAREVKIHRVNN